MLEKFPYKGTYFDVPVFKGVQRIPYGGTFLSYKRVHQEKSVLNMGTLSKNVINKGTMLENVI